MDLKNHKNKWETQLDVHEWMNEWMNERENEGAVYLYVYYEEENLSSIYNYIVQT